MADEELQENLLGVAPAGVDGVDESIPIRNEITYVFSGTEVLSLDGGWSSAGNVVQASFTSNINSLRLIIMTRKWVLILYKYL